MEPPFRCQGRLRNKAHPDSYRENKHIEFYVKTYVSICLCGSKKP